MASGTGLKFVSPKSEVQRRHVALAMNIQAARGLQDVLRSNLGPKGTMKMLVNGAGDIKLTKDGNVLLHEMQIQNPTANLIARTATAQDDIVGDGTTSIVLTIGEVMSQAMRYVFEGLHPRVLVDGIEKARLQAIEIMDKLKVEKEVTRDFLVSVARTSLRTKLPEDLAKIFTEMVVDSVLTIQKPDTPIDLHMVELQTMMHKSSEDSRFVKGLVLDHGARHADMRRDMHDVAIMTLNVALEYEKTEMNSGFYFSSVDQRTRMADAERSITEQRLQAIVDLKNKVCDSPDKGFLVVNQKGIDLPSLDFLASHGITALRRAKRRNMERLTLACGGVPLNSLDDLSTDVLGHADHVFEQTLGEDKFTFVEGVQHPLSCTILIKAPTKHGIQQLKDAVRDGLRAVKTAIEDKAVLPGAGAFEVACAAELMKWKDNVEGRAKLGVQAYADALLVIPKTLASNGGFDPLDTIIALQEEYNKGHLCGIDLESGNPLAAEAADVWDSYRAKKQMLHSGAVIATQLLLVDEIVAAGKTQGAPAGPMGPMG